MFLIVDMLMYFSRKVSWYKGDDGVIAIFLPDVLCHDYGRVVYRGGAEEREEIQTSPRLRVSAVKIRVLK